MPQKEYIAELYSLYEDKMQSEIITQEITDINNKIINMTNEFNKSLSDEQKIILQDLLEVEHHLQALENEQVFIYAFTLAIKLFLDGALNERNVSNAR